MKKFIFRYKILIISAILSIIVLFFLKPVIEVIPYENAYHCPVFNSVPYQKFCSINIFSSIFNYLLVQDQINWGNLIQFFVSFIVLFTLFYIELKFLLPVILYRGEKTSQLFNFFKTVAVLVCILFFTVVIYYEINDCLFYESFCDFGG